MAYVTHDQSEALTMSDRVAVFFDGKIQQIASPDSLYEDPANAFVADFIGENNGMSGRIASLDSRFAALELADGVSIFGKHGADLRAGHVGVLALRPERVLFNPGEGNGMNRVSGRVEDITYCGDHRRIQIATGGARNFIIKVPNTEGHRLPPSGETVTVGWRYEDCKILASTVACGSIETNQIKQGE